MLTGIFLKNFQTIKEPTFISLDKLCLLYGPNSAGKSSILDAIKLLKDIAFNSGNTSAAWQFIKNSAERFDGAAVGIEFVCQSFGNDSKDVNQWWDMPNARDEYLHQDFFLSIKGKKVQIEFADQGSTIRIAIEGKPLFEINSHFTNFDYFYQRQDVVGDAYGDQSEAIFEDRFITGQLVVYKSNELNHLYDYDLSDFTGIWGGKHRLFPHHNSYFYDLFAQDSEEVLWLNGISFSLDGWMQSNLVGVHFRVEDFVFEKYEELSGHWTRDEDKKRYLEFIKEHFSKEGNEEFIQQRHRIFFGLQSIARDLDKIVQGFFYQIQMAMEYSHVRGDRQVLNSENCFSYPEDENLKLMNSVGGYGEPMARYARYLSNLEAFQYPAPCMDFDFVNASLDKYIPSLKGYVIESNTYSLKHPSDEDWKKRELIYLNVKNKTGKVLGFQDVGSGISYIFPILASLWASKMNFIEQPELHLHPSAQCELGDVFITAFNNQSLAIIESHSEHLLLRLLRRIRETTKGYLMPKEFKFSNEDLRIYYFKPEPEGHTTVKEIRVDKYGELLTPWPGGFFSERDRELFDE
jgi:hypothetical protein